MSYKKRSRRPRLRKKTEYEHKRFREEYAATLSPSSRLPPLVSTLQSVAGNAEYKTRLLFIPNRQDLTEEQRERERIAVAEAVRKSKQIMPLYNKGAYQYITESDKSALMNDGRGKK